MKKEDIIILILGILLLACMLWTLFFGGGKSRHGVGSMEGAFPIGNQGVVRKYISRAFACGPFSCSLGRSSWIQSQ
ncbi:MAG: hypothetical protein ACYC9M_09800 [Desulfobulbaceae bacterium]